MLAVRAQLLLELFAILLLLLGRVGRDLGHAARPAERREDEREGLVGQLHRDLVEQRDARLEVGLDRLGELLELELARGHVRVHLDHLLGRSARRLQLLVDDRVCGRDVLGLLLELLDDEARDASRDRLRLRRQALLELGARDQEQPAVHLGHGRLHYERHGRVPLVNELMVLLQRALLRLDRLEVRLDLDGRELLELLEEAEQRLRAHEGALEQLEELQACRLEGRVVMGERLEHRLGQPEHVHHVRLDRRDARRLRHDRLEHCVQVVDDLLEGRLEGERPPLETQGDGQQRGLPHGKLLGECERRLGRPVGHIDLVLRRRVHLEQLQVRAHAREHERLQLVLHKERQLAQDARHSRGLVRGEVHRSLHLRDRRELLLRDGLDRGRPELREARLDLLRLRRLHLEKVLQVARCVEHLGARLKQRLGAQPVRLVEDDAHAAQQHWVGREEGARDRLVRRLERRREAFHSTHLGHVRQGRRGQLECGDGGAEGGGAHLVVCVGAAHRPRVVRRHLLPRRLHRRRRPDALITSGDPLHQARLVEHLRHVRQAHLHAELLGREKVVAHRRLELGAQLGRLLAPEAPLDLALEIKEQVEPGA